MEGLKEERHGETCAALFLGISCWVARPRHPRSLLRRPPLLRAHPLIPGRHRVGVGPEALAGCLGRLLDLRELALPVVLDAPPGEPLGDLLPVHVVAAGMDVRDDPAVAVLVDLLDLDDLALDQVTQGLAGDVAERLGLLGGVDAVEPDLQLAVLDVEASERLAVGDRADLELLGQREAGEGQEEDGAGRQKGRHERSLVSE